MLIATCERIAGHRVKEVKGQCFGAIQITAHGADRYVGRLRLCGFTLVFSARDMVPYNGNQPPMGDEWARGRASNQPGRRIV